MAWHRAVRAGEGSCGFVRRDSNSCGVSEGWNPAPNLCNSAPYDRCELLRKGAESSLCCLQSYQFACSLTSTACRQPAASSIPVHGIGPTSASFPLLPNALKMLDKSKDRFSTKVRNDAKSSGASAGISSPSRLRPSCSLSQSANGRSCFDLFLDSSKR